VGFKVFSQREGAAPATGSQSELPRTKDPPPSQCTWSAAPCAAASCGCDRPCSPKQSPVQLRCRTPCWLWGAGMMPGLVLQHHRQMLEDLVQHAPPARMAPAAKRKVVRAHFCEVGQSIHSFLNVQCQLSRLSRHGKGLYKPAALLLLKSDSLQVLAPRCPFIYFPLTFT